MHAKADHGRTRLRAFVGGNVVAALAIVVALIAGEGWSIPSPDRPIEFGLLVLLLIVAELCPISIQRGEAKDVITVSGPFAVALLLRWPLIFVLIAQGVASLVDGAAHKLAWWVRVFNVSQYAVSLGTAGWVFRALAEPIPRTSFDTGDFGAALIAGLTFFLLNNTLTGIGIALSERFPVRPFLLEDFSFQLMTNGGLIALAPVLLVVIDRHILLMAVLLVPFVAIYRGATVALEKEHQARHDALTGLPNRTELEAIATRALGSAGPERLSVGVMMVDLNNFKDVNDTLGHDVGDSLLRQVAARLGDALSGSATVGRFGGDQFAVVAPALKSPFDAPGIARQVLDQFGPTFEVEGSMFDLRARVGLAVSPQHGEDVGLLLRHSEIALEGAKARHSELEIYEPATNQYTRRRLKLATDLRTSLETGELAVHYQPIVDLGSKRVVSVEALLRWEHPDFGLVAPDEVIALAERTGSIGAVTEFVLSTALRQVSSWRRDGIDVGVSVNVSGQDLNATLPARIATLLAISGVPSTRLTLELTETAIVEDPEVAARIIQELKAMLVRVAIDDFGTGYSSLAYLKRLPVDEIKIDRSFVTNMPHDSADEMIVQSTIDLARNLKLSVVGEGIETPRIWKMLADMGCARGQGYLLGRPGAAHSVAGLLGGSLSLPAEPEVVVTLEPDELSETA
jgi:diguanylate cyclase (GGDEF)-like protein